MIERSRRGDGYARLSPAGTDVLLWPEEGGLLFVDLAFRARSWDSLESAIRTVPPSLLADASRVLFRSPIVRWVSEVEHVEADDPRRLVVVPGWTESPQDLADLIGNMMIEHKLPRRPVGVFELPVGAEALTSEGVTPEELAQARGVELEGFLRRSGAIWQPPAYHYRLPSGAHAGSFVRVADAFRDPRAPEALATWLYGALTSTTVVIVDSGSLMPLVQQLDLVVARASAKLPLAFGGLSGVEAIDEYPLSRFELQRRFERVESTDLLALLSVSSTGRTYRVLGQSLSQTAGENWRAECLVSRDSQASALPGQPSMGLSEPWLQIEALEEVQNAQSCGLCKSPKRARVVHIDPRTFSAMALPAPTLLMADTFSARRNASLFEIYRQLAKQDRRTVQLAGTERSRARAEPHHRPDDPRRVRFEPTALLRMPDVATRLTDRIAHLHDLRTADPSKRPIDLALKRVCGGEPTIAVCDPEELRVLAVALETGATVDGVAAARHQMLVAAQAVCPSVVAMLDGDDSLAASLGDHSRVLVFAAGLLTGVTLQHLVYTVRSAFSTLGRDPEMFGLVLHAHPYDSEAWASVRNSFGGRKDPAILALWLTYLPEESPLAHERDALRLADDSWFAGARPGAHELWSSRSSWLSTERPTTAEVDAPTSPLWVPDAQELGRTSIFGELDDRHTLVAVGAALQEALDRSVSQGAPDWVQVDLPNALRSFFDGLLHVALLRWTVPARAWWGRPNECRALLEELKGRFTRESDDWKLLLPELLLASAMGKVPDEGVEFLVAEADRELELDEWPGEILDFVALGLVMVEHLWPANQR